MTKWLLCQIEEEVRPPVSVDADGTTHEIALPETAILKAERFICKEILRVVGVRVHVKSETCQQCQCQEEYLQPHIDEVLKVGFLMQHSKVSLLSLAQKLQARKGSDAVKKQLMEAAKAGRRLDEVLYVAEELKLQ